MVVTVDSVVEKLRQAYRCSHRGVREEYRRICLANDSDMLVVVCRDRDAECCPTSLGMQRIIDRRITVCRKEALSRFRGGRLHDGREIVVESLQSH